MRSLILAAKEEGAMEGNKRMQLWQIERFSSDIDHSALGFPAALDPRGVLSSNKTACGCCAYIDFDFGLRSRTFAANAALDDNLYGSFWAESSPAWTA